MDVRIWCSMARISLYVPDDLKERMDASGDAINWSVVARPSLNAALAAYERRTGATMTTAVERLRASRLEAAQEDWAIAIENGRAWARDIASYRALERLLGTKLTGFDALVAAIKPDDTNMTEDDVLRYCT